MLKTCDDLGKLVLRVTVAGLLVLHGIHKIQHGIEGIEGLVVAEGLPEFLAYGVYVGEILAPALLIVGFQTRLAALVVAGNMAVALWLVHMDHLGLLGPTGAWKIESLAFFLLGAVSIMLLGAGRYSIDGRKTKIV